jgi:TonB-dependent receptor
MQSPHSSGPRLNARVRLFAVAVIALCLGAVDVFAQATGTIEGRVLNVGTGKYLNNARVTIEGTKIETLTNEYGDYRLTGVPAGEVKVQAFYTGLDLETATVTVKADTTANQDFSLSSRDRYGDDKTIVMDVYRVAAAREFEGNAIATNEQRFAPNVKVVMAADAFGDVTEGNVGEFLKYLPGVTVDYVAADVRTASVRGFPDNFTNVYMDGVRLTSSQSANSNRVFEFEQFSINNAARVEVIKVPTPDIPSDSLGGSINVISKNAFERKGAQFNYRAYLSFNNEATDLLKQTPGPGDKKTYKVLPGFDFDYTLPVSKKFGLVITGLSSNQYNEQHRWNPTWNFAQAGATIANPYLQQFQMQDGPKNTFRDSIGIKADWRITNLQTLSVGVQDNYYKSFFGNRNINFNIGTNATPTPATGTALLWGPTFVQSATGRASVTQSGSFRDKLGDTKVVNLKYSYNGRDWSIDAGLHGTKSKTWYRDLARGQWSAFSTQLQNVSTVRVDNIDFPAFNWVARDAAGNNIDYNNLANYRVTTTRAQPADGKAKMKGAFVDVKRDIAAVSFPLSIKAGLAVREEDRDNRRYQEDYTFLGADGVANTADDAALPFLDASYVGVDPHWGAAPIQWGSPYVLANLYRTNPGYFRQGTGTAQTGVQAESFRILNSQKITETISSAYVMAEAKLLDSRLLVVTGVRFEKTEDQGEGALIDPDAAFVRNADGTFARDGSNNRIRKANAGTAGSLAELSLTNLERGYKASKEYDGYYPSLHLTYSVRDNLLLRFAYAKTVGRPDYVDIIPTATIDDNEAADLNPALSPGTITFSNTQLKPWTANNYDLALELYTKNGGLITASVFRKDLKDFWGFVSRPLTAGDLAAFGLDSVYLNWTGVSRENVGAARISGGEFNVVQKLTFLPGWGRDFSVNANSTWMHLQGSNAADFNRFISRTANASLSWNRKPFAARLTFNHRGRQRGVDTNPALQSGGAYGGAVNGFYAYYAPRTTIDINAEYTWSKRLKFFANARNLTNKQQIIERKNLASPAYANEFRAEEFGVQFAVGVKGTW